MSNAVARGVSIWRYSYGFCLFQFCFIFDRGMLVEHIEHGVEVFE